MFERPRSPLLLVRRGTLYRLPGLHDTQTKYATRTKRYDTISDRIK
jgi:hypothetical protein